MHPQNFRRIILAVGVLTWLFVSLFPPLRSPSEYYANPQVIDNQFVASQLPRIPSTPGLNLGKLQNGVVVRTEIDAGELLRELALIIVVFGSAYLCAPSIAYHAHFIATDGVDQ